jgi:cellulose synthase/poly-beta-1,6-N-acetylglucosamine synthase-like glycosyltransferase
MIADILWFLVFAHIVATWLLAIQRGRHARRSGPQRPQSTSKELPPVSVIVPAWDEKGTIEKHIAALRRVEYPLWEAIILAGGEDGTHAASVQAAAGEERFRILERGPEPKNAALNRGVGVAQYDIVVLLDCDNIVEPGWLAALIAPIASGASVSVGHSHPNKITWVTLEERMQNIYIYQVLKRSWIQGDRSIAIRRELLERIGGLPVHTYAREDWDIWARLGETGERVAFAEGAYLTTDRPATLKQSWNHQVRWRRTHLSGMWEHRSTLIKQPVDLFNQLYGYLQGIVVLLLLLTALITTIFWPGRSSILWNLLALLIVWFCGRQAAIAFAVAAYTGDWIWGARAWLPALNLLLLRPASLVALLTFNRLNPYYKGPRHTERLSKTT